MADSPSDDSEPSAGDTASDLGELFARQPPKARALVDDLKREHPDADDDNLIRLAKRRASRRIAADLQHDDDGKRLRDTVAELAVTLAILRDSLPQSTAGFAELGQRIVASAERTASIHGRVSTTAPLAVAGFEQVARRVQPFVAELLFGVLGGTKPKRPGMARDAYKAARSATWRARHDRNISAAAAGGAAAALVAAVDAAAPPIIVGLVDRSVRPKSGGQTRPKLGRKLRKSQLGEVSEAEKNHRTDG